MPQTEQQAVNAIGLTQSNVPGHYRTKNAMPSGDIVAGQVTLDMCGANFRSERLRIARHQVAFPAKDHRSSVSTETVAYSPRGAALAMREVRRAIATCPQGLVASHVQGMPLLTQRFSRLPARPGWEPGTIAHRVTETTRSGESSSGIIIYQRHGNILNGIYVWGSGPQALRVASRCALLMANELDAAPGGATNNA